MLSTTAYLSTQGELHLGGQRRSLTGSPMTIRVQMAVARLVDGLASPDLSRFWNRPAAQRERCAPWSGCQSGRHRSWADRHRIMNRGPHLTIERPADSGGHLPPWHPEPSAGACAPADPGCFTPGGTWISHRRWPGYYRSMDLQAGRSSQAHPRRVRTDPVSGRKHRRRCGHAGPV